MNPMKKLLFLILKIVFFSLIFMDNFQVSKSFDYDHVTMGSVVKLANKQHHKARLHSHEVKYGSGSGQQSVTGMKKMEDANSYWQVRSPQNGEVLPRGTPIKCGSQVRLTHLNTQSNIHSHHFRAPISNHANEVSCFGTDGEGDKLDNWTVECSGSWLRGQYVAFRHTETGNYLSMSDQTFGRPISGQHEVCASGSLNNNARWKTMEGVYIKPSE